MLRLNYRECDYLHSGRDLKRSRSNMADSSKSNVESKCAQIEMKTGDLFTCPDEHSLAHCISADIKMGKGIAVKFKQLFGGVDELVRQRQVPGGLAVLQRDSRFVYYLVTKEKYWLKPTYGTLTESLKRMKEHNLRNNVTHVSMPMIGCGLDKLKWPNVLDILHNVYKDTDIHITVYQYEGKKESRRNNEKDSNEGQSRHGNHLRESDRRTWQRPSHKQKASSGDIRQHITSTRNDMLSCENTASQAVRKEGRSEGSSETQDNSGCHGQSSTQQKGKVSKDENKEDNLDRKQEENQGHTNDDHKSSSSQQKSGKSIDAKSIGDQNKQGNNEKPNHGSNVSAPQDQEGKDKDEGAAEEQGGVRDEKSHEARNEEDVETSISETATTGSPIETRGKDGGNESKKRRNRSRKKKNKKNSKDVSGE